MTTPIDGRFFEDFRLGQRLCHVGHGPVTAQQAQENARLTGSIWRGGALDDVLTFNLVFGLSVADISLNAVANLGYAEGRFGADLMVGDDLAVESEVIGLRQVSSGRAGVVYVQTLARNQRQEEVLRYKRWVLVNKRDASAPAPVPHIPPFPQAEEGRGEGIFMPYSGHMTITEEQHQQLTRLYHNPAKLHFDAGSSPYGKCLVYGGVVIALAWSLRQSSGRAPACNIKSIIGGTHHNPAFAGDTVHAAATEYPDGRITLWARKNSPFTAPPDPADPDVVLQWDIAVS